MTRNRPTGRPRTLHPLWQAALISTLVGAAFSLVGVFVGIGLPGPLVTAPAVEIARLFLPVPPLGFPRDSAWPFMMYVTLLWGLAVPVCWLVTRRWQGWRRAVAFLLGFGLLGVAIATVPYVSGTAPRP